MLPKLVRALSPLLIVLLARPPAWATCGGGGGGGAGGIAPSGLDEEVYQVPWKLRAPEDPPVTSGLVLYWFPSSAEELRRSSLRTSRSLALRASQCVSMEVAAADSPAGRTLAAGIKLPVAVLATADGVLVGRAENQDNFLRVSQVEKLVDDEVDRREKALARQLDDAKAKTKAGDSAAAIALFRSVLTERCLFPKKAKDAAKALKKLGVEDVGELSELPGPVLDSQASKRVEATMLRGLRAEREGRYPEAARQYERARAADPADPAPLRYLGELQRHHTGDWAAARRTFEKLRGMPADPLSRAVALHGLGKMTIHEGSFAQGLALLEASIRAYPLALAYRNLAVYWNSEGDADKTSRYVQDALALDHKDAYSIVFAAVFMAASGHGDEALAIAQRYEALLPASYNLAAVYAQVGERDKALALLRRHFFEYERYQAVRAKEMMEARVDAVFASLRDDPAFVALTAGADGTLDASRSMSR
jgi:tetratricopeptide (TPR) repeat protein